MKQSKIKKKSNGFFSSKFNVVLCLALIFLGMIALFVTNDNSDSYSNNIGSSYKNDSQPSNVIEIHFFYLPTCPHCTEQKPIYNEFKEEHPEISFFEHDASTKQGSELFYKLSKEAGLDTSSLGVPTIFVGKHPLVGVHSKEQIAGALNECLSECKNEEYIIKNENESQNLNTGFSNFEIPFLGKVDLLSWSLPTLAIVLGLIDGFNPCAMWVLVYLIGILMGINDKRKIWIIVGSFVLASGIMYFLFMAAWINIFMLIGYIKILTILIGMVALGGGILNLKEYFTTKDALTCKVGNKKSHEKTMNKIDKIASSPLTIGLIFSIIGLAFVVNSVEFVCSAAIPAVFTQILAISGISSLQYYLYIALYVFFFMLDDLIIFGMAAFAVGTAFGNKYAKYCKLFGGIILTILGLIMLFMPHLLR
jgi:thiol-disulfide isomerase/thioredoxin